MQLGDRFRELIMMQGNLEKFLWLAVAGIFGVNSTESEGEQTGIIREQIRAADERCRFFEVPSSIL